MRKKRLAGCLVLAVLAVCSVAQAGGEVRRDPKGVKGISPFWEAIRKGDAAYIARDFDAALAAYSEAIQQEPQNGLGHYRAGEAYLAKGDLKKAEEAWMAALRFASSDRALKAKVLFVLADLRERQQSYQEAKDAWATYKTNVQGAAGAYPETADDRAKRIDEWVDTKAKYEPVKQRILTRLAEADKKARDQAAKEGDEKR
jgi:tetratricopeptide (TPR) repeat protein